MDRYCKMRSVLLAVALQVLLEGCGADHGDLPFAEGGGPAPRPPVPGVGSASPDPSYPGPYGTNEQEVARNRCFEVWDNPSAQGFDPTELEMRCFEDYYDAEAAEHRLLLVTTAASWCTNCAAEFGGSSTRPSLGQEIGDRRGAGLSALSVLFQDEAFQPADAADAATWARRYAIDFNFGLDADFGMGVFADPTVQPFNMVVDTRDMRILLKLQGDQPAVLWSTISQFLSQP